MLVIPIGTADTGETLTWAVDQGVSFLGEGPIPG